MSEHCPSKQVEFLAQFILQTRTANVNSHCNMSLKVSQGLMRAQTNRIPIVSSVKLLEKEERGLLWQLRLKNIMELQMHFPQLLMLSVLWKLLLCFRLHSQSPQEPAASTSDCCLPQVQMRNKVLGQMRHIPFAPVANDFNKHGRQTSQRQQRMGHGCETFPLTQFPPI